ncbi:unnamed protein product, partial [Ectocarpus sp. 12 AP-2014]
QEKSLGGLCRRFVQLFLVGNDVVSVGEAAEKLSEPSDVAGSTVVFKTRARRLYDIANALAALGLVDKVRSKDSCKPNFRWIGVPVRTLPLLDPSQAQQAGTAAGPPHAAAAATADNNRLPSPTTTSGPCPKSGSLVAPAVLASNAFGYAAGEAAGGVVAAAVAAAAAAAAAAPASPAVGTPGFSWNPLGVGTLTASKGNDVENAGLGTAGGAGDAWAENDLNDMGEVWTPLAAAVAGFGTEVGSESRRSRLRRPSFDGMSPPSTLASTRWVSPSDTPYAAKAEVATDGGSCGSTTMAPTPAAAAAADGPKAAATALSSSFVAPEGPSDAMSDQGSPVDPRQVMREFPDPGSYDASSSSSSSSSSSTSVERWGRKRRRSVPRYDNDDDAWLAHQGDGGGGGGEKKKEEDAFSPAQLTAAKSAAVAASKMAEVRAAATTTTTTTTTPGRAAAASPPPASSGGGGGGRKRARNRSVGAAVARTTTTTNAGSCQGGVLTPNTRPGAASASSSASGSRGGAVARALNAAPPSRARNKDAVGRKQGGARGGGGGGGGGGGKAGGEGAMMDGDAQGGAMRWFSLGGGGAAVAVTPEESPLAPPPDPSSVKECLDEYMETYTEQWNTWREGGTGDFRPPTFLSPGLGTAFGSSPTSPTFFASPPPPPAESNSAFSRSSKDWGSDEAGADGSSA